MIKFIIKIIIINVITVNNMAMVFYFEFHIKYYIFMGQNMLFNIYLMVFDQNS